MSAFTLSASPDEAEAEAETGAASPIAIPAPAAADQPQPDQAHFILSTSPDDDNANDNDGPAGGSATLFANAPDTPIGKSQPLPFRRGPLQRQQQQQQQQRMPNTPQRTDTHSTFASSPRSSSHASIDTSADSLGTASSSSPSRTPAPADNQSSSKLTMSQSHSHRQLHSPATPAHSRTMSTSSIASSLGVTAPVPSPAHDRRAHDAYARSQQHARHGRGVSTSSSSGGIPIPVPGSSAADQGSSSRGVYTADGLSSSPSRSSSTANTFPFNYRETLNARTDHLADGSRTINQYRMLDQIGRGAYGVVYWAELISDPSVTFAIKEFGKTRLRKTYRAANMRKTARMRGRGRGGGLMSSSSAESGRAESALAALVRQDATDALAAPLPPQPPTSTPVLPHATITAPGPGPGPGPEQAAIMQTPQLVMSPSTAELNVPILSSSPTSASPDGDKAAAGGGIQALARGIKALQMDPASTGAQRSGFSLDQQSAAELQQAGGPSAHPAGPSAHPAGPSAHPAGPSAHPAGPSAHPAGPSAHPAGPSAHPAGPSAHPAGPSSTSGSAAAAAPPPPRASTLETDPLFLIRHEIAILKKLNHPNVVKLYEVLDDPSQDSLYMVFESCSNGPVIEVHIHEQSQSLDEDVAREYFAQILLGIEYLHSNEIVHRDIKPDNILLTSDRQICKIVDFGVSEIFLKPNEDKLAKSAGTPAFMSPELCTAGTGDVHAMADDIWALGVTLYCMVVGRLPFEKSQIYELFETIKNDEPEYPSHLSPGLLDLLQGLLRKDHRTRYGIAEAREHPWVTYDGTYPLVSVEENLETVVHEITEEELERAICKITSVL
ncbi:hypothetical protein CF328_g6962 [Tilletia controversa]|nr:hypothetical protein CF328_g6962 [Tilletia controversa]